jgi:VWA domain-containing protein
MLNRSPHRRPTAKNEIRAAVDALNQVDLCFTVDTTGSMGPFIQAAKQHLLETIRTLRADQGIDLQAGLVEYRDHPPQDRSFVTRLYPLTADLEEMQRVINSLRADGGGDAPEAVFDGVHDACNRMSWREHSCRFVLLVGDSPPHGVLAAASEAPVVRGRHRHGGHADAWADGCPCGLNVHAVTAAAENRRVTVHSLCMHAHAATVESFREIALGTGGQCVPATNAMEVVGQIAGVLTQEFRDLEFDRRVLHTVRELGSLDVGRAAETVGCPRLQAASSMARLGRRGFLEGLSVEQ